MYKSLINKIFGNSIEESLFNTYILIFFITGMVTILGIINVIYIEKSILDLLFKLLIVEVIGGITSLFIKTLIKKKIKQKIRFIIDPLFVNDLENNTKRKIKCFIKDVDNSQMYEESFDIVFDEEGPYIELPIIKLRRTIHFDLHINSIRFKGYIYLGTRSIALTKFD